ncbi:MAG TPA: hypothetical protein VEF76_01425 [Patescibacteria group bacterium]|nr:hypothetical protein [Patescibacteria group bacterium]
MLAPEKDIARQDDFNRIAGDSLRRDTFDVVTPVHLALFETLFDLANARGGAKLVEDVRFELLQRMLRQHQALELVQKQAAGAYIDRLGLLDRRIMATTLALARDHLPKDQFEHLSYTRDVTRDICDDLRRFPEMAEYAVLFEPHLDGPRRGPRGPQP